jgi:DNA repair exonuclease SbcCD ATPase subunit
MTPEQFQSYKQAAIDAFTGVGEKTKELQKELSILRGETTAQEIEFQRMLQAGASNAQIEALRQMQAEREKLLAQQEEEAKRQADITAAAEQSKAALQAEVDAIKDSIKTPKQKLDERLERINELEKSGMLNVMEAALAAKQVQDEMKQLDQQTAPAAVSQEPRFAGAAMRGSGEAFSTILRSMGRKDPNVAATEKQTKDLVAAMKQNKPEFAVAEGA